MRSRYRVRTVASAKLLRPYKLLALMLLPVLAGCSSTFKLMPAPAYVDTDAYEAAARSVYDRDETPGSIRLFYATDRVPPDTPGGCDYSRQRGDRLRLGRVEVAIGDGQWSAMELHENIRAGGESRRLLSTTASRRPCFHCARKTDNASKP